MSKRARSPSSFTVYEFTRNLLERCKEDTSFFLTIEADIIDFLKDILIFVTEQCEFPNVTKANLLVMEKYNIGHRGVGSELHFDIQELETFILRYTLAVKKGKWLVIDKSIR